jgi:hypothetical protein
MPTYTFVDKNTGEETEHFMSLSEREDFLLANPHLETIIKKVNIVTSAMSGSNKPDDGFRDVLKRIKKGSPRSNINTF